MLLLVKVELHVFMPVIPKFAPAPSVLNRTVLTAVSDRIMSAKADESEALSFAGRDGPVTKAQLFEAFDVLPSLIDVLKDILSAGASQETTRLGDISASAVTIKQKYGEALELLRALPGTDTSLEEQESAIESAKEELKRASEMVEFYSNTLYRGTDEPRAEINDAFSRRSL